MRINRQGIQLSEPKRCSEKPSHFSQPFSTQLDRYVGNPTNYRLESQSTWFDQGPDAGTIRVENFYADRVETSRFVDGSLQFRDTINYSNFTHTVEQFDLGAENWRSIVSTITADGKLDKRVTNYDNGNQRVRDVDLLNQYRWNISEDLFVYQNGTLKLNQRIEYDTNYTMVTTYNYDTPRSWNLQINTYNHVGRLVEQTTQTATQTVTREIYAGPQMPALSSANGAWITGNSGSAIYDISSENWNYAPIDTRIDFTGSTYLGDFAYSSYSSFGW